MAGVAGGIAECPTSGGMGISHMKIAIASGKGGTGKTTLAVNMALSAEGPVQLLDCDVEEPNCHIFLKVTLGESKAVTVPVPQVDVERCNGCGKCGEICRYSAIVSLKTKPLVFPEMCHGCGGCSLVCPRGAISETGREVGVVERGAAGDLRFIRGLLRIGEAMAPPLIRAVKKEADNRGLVIIDAPPGTSCPVIEAVKGADYVVLVTEPTPFGLHDLKLAVDMVGALSLPFGVVVNRVGIGDDRVSSYCVEHGISVLAEIPDDRRIAQAYSRGEPIVEAVPEYGGVFRAVMSQISGILERA